MDSIEFDFLVSLMQELLGLTFDVPDFSVNTEEAYLTSSCSSLTVKRIKTQPIANATNKVRIANQLLDLQIETNFDNLFTIERERIVEVLHLATRFSDVVDLGVQAMVARRLAIELPLYRKSDLIEVAKTINARLGGTNRCIPRPWLRNVDNGEVSICADEEVQRLRYWNFEFAACGWEHLQSQLQGIIHFPFASKEAFSTNAVLTHESFSECISIKFRRFSSELWGES